MNNDALDAVMFNWQNKAQKAAPHGPQLTKTERMVLTSGTLTAYTQIPSVALS